MRDKIVNDKYVDAEEVVKVSDHEFDEDLLEYESIVWPKAPSWFYD